MPQRLTLALALLCCVTTRAEPPEATIWLGGDVHVGSREGDLLAPLRPFLDGAAGIVNLEGPIAAKTPKGKGVRLHNHPRALGMLRGVDVVSVANNHALDAGDPNATIAQARKLGFTPVGLDAGDAVIERGGLRIVVTAFDLTHGVPAELSTRLVRAAAKGDVLVTTFHTTGPASYLPDRILVEAVNIAVSSGSTVIAAHGSHMPGPVERRGDAVIAWGLGNLLFDCTCTRETDALVLRVALQKGRAVRAEVIPVDAGLTGQPAQPAHDPAMMLDLLEALGSRGLRRDGARAWL